MSQLVFRSDDTIRWAQKYGRGVSGDVTESVTANYSTIYDSFNGTAGTNSITTSTTSFSDGDIVVLAQMRGTSVGAVMLNVISSGGGTTSLTMMYALTNTFTDSGSSQAVIVKALEYNNYTINSGVTMSCQPWQGNLYGIVPIFVKDTATINGTINLSAKGYRGGLGSGNANVTGSQGEGTVGIGTTVTTANGSGGGAGNGDGGNGSPGAGGGHGASGGDAFGSIGGSAVGSADMITLFMGGGGGGDADDSGQDIGGAGGGILMLFAKNIVGTGSIISNGGNGSASNEAGAGGGAGGSILLKGETINILSMTVTALGGSGGVGSLVSGAHGAVGRIHADYAKSFSGTTTPTINTRQDASLFSNTHDMFLVF